MTCITPPAIIMTSKNYHNASNTGNYYIFRGINVERISADKVAWEDNVPKLKDFYKKNMVAEFFTGRVKRNVKLY